MLKMRLLNLQLSTNPQRAEVELSQAANTAVEWAAGAPLIFGGDVNLRLQSTDAFDQLEPEHGPTGTTAPDAIDHLLSRGLETVEPPRAWPTEARELDYEGLALRLSDHAPVVARFSTP